MKAEQIVEKCADYLDEQGMPIAAHKLRRGFPWTEVTEKVEVKLPEEETMDIYSPPGTKVRFNNYGGYPKDSEKARKFLTLGQVYTVRETEVDNWRTDVCLREFPGERFNHTLFVKV